jgi:predicted acyltransferase (DUF342 family)
MSQWLDLSNAANKIRQTYIKGFLDVSGGGIYLRNDMSLNFYDNTGSGTPAFSIKSDSMRIPDKFGVFYDVSVSQILCIKDLSVNLQSQLTSLVDRTKHITSDSNNIDTMMEFDSINNKIIVHADIVPSAPFAQDLGSAAVPFGSLFVKQGTIHFIDDVTNDLAASISYNTQTGSLDLSTNGFTSTLNNTTFVNGVLSKPVLSKNGNIGIGVDNPQSALDIMGVVKIQGNAIIDGGLVINNGDTIMNGNLIIGDRIFEGGVPLSTKYLSSESPSISGAATLSNATITSNLIVLGDASFNGQVKMGSDVVMNGNLFVNGKILTNTPEANDNSQLVATTQFVKNQGYAPLLSPSFFGTTNMVIGNIAQKLTVGGDLSLNSKLSVFSSATFNNTVTVQGNTILNNKLSVLGDISLNGQLNTNGQITTITPTITDNSTKVATTAYVQNQGYANLSGAVFTGDISLNANLSVGGNVLISGITTLANAIVFTQLNSDNSDYVATTAFVKNQAYAKLASPTFLGTTTIPYLNITQGLTVTCDSTFIGNLSVNGNLTAITQFSSDSTTKVATTQFVKNQGYATIISPTFTGTVSAPRLNITQLLSSDTDVSFNARLSVQNDTTLLGNVAVGGQLTMATSPSTNDNSTKAATTAYVQNQGYAKLTGAVFSGDISMNNRLSVGGDVSMNGNMDILGNVKINGHVLATTQINDDYSTKVATTEFVKNQGYAPIVSPEFTGIPLAPTPLFGTNTNQIATTEFVLNQLFSFINSNQEVYNSLQQLSNALSSTDASFATTLAQSLGLKADINSPVFDGMATMNSLTVNRTILSLGDVTLNSKLLVEGDVSLNGNVTAITPSTIDSSNKVATTAYVQNQEYAKLSGANFSGSISTGGNLSVSGNTVIQNLLTVLNDVSMNANLSIGGKSVLNGLVTALHGMNITGDVSIGGNLSVNGGLTLSNGPSIDDNSNKVATTAFIKNQGYARLSEANFTGDVSFNSKLSVGEDAFFGKNVAIYGNADVYGTLVAKSDVSFNNKLFVLGDISSNKNIYVGGNISEGGRTLSSKYAKLESPHFTGTVTGITKSMVDLSNVDNTADINKPISNDTQNALNLKANKANPIFTGIVQTTTVSVQDNLYVLGDVSFNGKLFVNSDVSLNGNLTTVTQPNSDISIRVATTEFVKNQEYAQLSGANFKNDVSFNKNVAVVGDVSMNGRLFTEGDVVMKSNVFINGSMVLNGDISMNSHSFLGNSVSIKGTAAISGDLSLNGNMNTNGQITTITSIVSDNSSKVATTAFVKNQGYAKLAGAGFTGDISTTGRMYVNSDVSFNKTLTIVGDISANSRLYLGSDAYMGSDITVFGKSTFGNMVTINNRLVTTNDISMNGTLLVGGDISLNGDLRLGGNLLAITQNNNENSNKVATTAYVKNQGFATLSSPTFTGTANMASLIVAQNLISNSDAYMQSSLFVTGDTTIGGNLTSTTPQTNDNSTQVATTAYVRNQQYATLESPIFTGKMLAFSVDISSNLSVIGDVSINGFATASTPLFTDESTKLATTAFVKNQGFASLNAATFIGKVGAGSLDISGNVVIHGDSSMNGRLMVGQSIFENGVLLSSTYAKLESPTFTGIVTGITKSMVGLTNVDNTTDINKPVSTAMQTALNLKANIANPIFTGKLTTGFLDVSNNVIIRGESIMGGNVAIGGELTVSSSPNISDNSSRVATTEFVQNQGFARLTGAVFSGDISTNNLQVLGNIVNSGVITTTTSIASDNSSRVATTEFVKAQGFASLVSPTFTGVPTAPTASTAVPTTNQIATTKYVEDKISDFFNTASTETLNTINSISQALSNTDSSFTLFIADQLKTKANIDAPTFTGQVSMPSLTVNESIYIGSDVSLNGNLKAGGIIYENGVALINKYASINSPTFTGTVTGITKSMVGLTNVDNTADIYKPVSTATQNALNLKANIANPVFTGTVSMSSINLSESLYIGSDVSVNGNLIAAASLYENGVLLSSTYAKLDSPAFTGVVTGITKEMVNLSNIDNTADINKPVSIPQQSALSLKANITNPAFTGFTSISQGLYVGSDMSMGGRLFVMGDISTNGLIYGLTVPSTDNSNKMATTAYVKSQASDYAKLTGAAFIGDVSINTRLSVGADMSLNGNLTVYGNIIGKYQANTIPLAAIIGGLGAVVDLYNNQSIYGVKTFMNDVSMNSRLFSNGSITLAGNNISSNLAQAAVQPTATSIENQIQLTNNANGTFIHQMEISKSNGITMAYNTTNGIPNISIIKGQTWSPMTTISPNTGFSGMVCISPDGRVILQQQTVSTTTTIYVSTNWGTTYTALSLAQSILFMNTSFGYNGYNDQTYAFSHDGSTLYFIARDVNNTVTIWKNTDSTFTSYTKQNQSWNYTLSNCPRAISTSYNGQYVLLITGIIPANGMYVYLSTNYGASYTRTANSLNTTWNSIAVSYSGKYLTATNNNQIYQSSDFGSTWTITTSAPTAKWNSISMSNDGKIRAGCIDSSYQYISLDYGSTWNVMSNTFGNWKKSVLVDMSNNDSVIIFAHDGVNIFEYKYNYVATLQNTTIQSNLNILTPNHYLNNMGKMLKVVKTNSFNNYVGARSAISSNGQYIISPITANQPILSQDYGTTWAPLTGLTAQIGYKYAAISGNGKYMFVRNGATTYWSQNTGLSWSLFTGVSAVDYNGGIALSYSGQYMVYAGMDGTNKSNVFVSSDYGATWTSVTIFATISTNFSAAMSDSGKYMSVLSTSGVVLVSSNYGIDWQTNSIPACSQIAMSSTGQYQTVISFSKVYVSTNYGQNFTMTLTDGSLSTVTMIGTGEYQYVVNNALLYRSTNFGSSWNPIMMNPEAPTNTVVSSDGTVMLYSNTNDIYVSRMADNVGTISNTAVSITKSGIVSSLDLSLNGTVSAHNIIVDHIYENGNLLASKYATLDGPVFTGTVGGITASMVGLSNVNNTSDANKPISTATQAAINLLATKESPSLTGTTSMQTTNISEKLTVVKDVSLNSRLFVQSDVSLNGLLYANYAPNTIPIEAIKGGIPSANGIFSFDISANGGLYVNGDASFNNRLMVNGDVSFNRKLFVGKDVSFNANLYVNGNAITNKDSIVAGNSYLLKNVSVNGDASMNGNLYIGNVIYENGISLIQKYAPIEYPTFTGMATFDRVTINAPFVVNSDSTMNGEASVTGNLLIDKKIFENGVALESKYATLASPTFTGTVSGITKTMVGLNNIDNTSDQNKPVSLATQGALDLKANIESPFFTGTPNAPTATTGTNTAQIATTAYVRGEIYNLIGSAPNTLNTLQELANAINSDASFATTVATQIGTKASITSPEFSGTVVIPIAKITDLSAQHLYVESDVAVNGRLYVKSDISLNGNVAIGGDTAIIGDLSVNGFIKGKYENYSIPSTAIENIRNQYGELQISTQRADIVTYDDESFELSRSSGDGAYVETLYSRTSDLSLNGNLYISGSGSSVFSNDVSVESNLQVNNNASLNGNLYVGQNAILQEDVVMNKNLDLSGSLIAHNNVNVYGIINQYTLSLEQGYIVDYNKEEAATITSLQAQVTSLQQQLANVLQILANHNLV